MMIGITLKVAHGCEIGNDLFGLQLEKGYLLIWLAFRIIQLSYIELKSLSLVGLPRSRWRLVARCERIWEVAALSAQGKNGLTFICLYCLVTGHKPP